MKIKSLISSAVLSVLLLTGCTSGVTPEKVELSSQAQNNNTATESTTVSAESEAPVQTEFLIGDTIKAENLQFTVTGTRTSPGGQFLQPQSGYEYLLVDVLVQNVGSETESISSFGMFSLFDEDGYKYNDTYYDETNGSLSGSIIAGKHIRGELAFEVPAGGAYKLQIDPTIFGLSGEFMVDLSKKSTADISLPDTMDTSSNVTFGDKMLVNDVTYKVNSFRTYNGDDFSQPDEGYTYYIFDVEVENNSSESVSVSSMMTYNLYDGQGYKQKSALLFDLKGSMNGEVLPGNKLRGEIAYEVPINSNNLEMWVEVYEGLDTEMFAVSVQ